MRRGFYTEELRRQLEPMAVVFLLPYFFYLLWPEYPTRYGKQSPVALDCHRGVVGSYRRERRGLLVSRSL